MRKALAALAALAGLAHAGGAAAQSEFLLSGTSVAPPPPLGPTNSAVLGQTEIQIPGHVASQELVDVGIGPDGIPVRVVVSQRLRIRATGDYSFVVPGPITHVARGRDSQSLPGLRDVGIVWQGFSSGNRVLSAIATLRPREATVGLPLRVAIERTGDSTAVRLENVARQQVGVVDGRTTRAAVLAALARIRARARPTRIAGGPGYVRGEASKGRQVDSSAPLRITGTIADGVPVDAVLGGERPLERTFEVPGGGAPKLRLRIELIPPIEILPTRAELARDRDRVVTLQAAIGQISISSLYRRFLATPDPAGDSDASYVYRSVPKPAAVAAPERRDDGDDTLAIVLGVALGAAALAGLAVVWARS